MFFYLSNPTSSGFLAKAILYRMYVAKIATWNGLSNHEQMKEYIQQYPEQLSQVFLASRGAFHLVKNSENSGSGLNGKRFFGSPGRKIPRKSGNA